MKRSALVAVLVGFVGLAIVAGCGGGGSTPPPSLPAAGQSGQHGTAQATIRIVIPPAPTTSSSSRRPAYVSPATQSVSISVAGGTAQVVALTPSNCTGSGTLTCTATFALPVGVDESMAVSTFASTDGTGSPLSINTVPETIVMSQANNLNFTLNGVVASYALVVSPTSMAKWTNSTITATYTALDASGNTIVGPGSLVDSTNTVVTPTLTSNDASGATSIGALSGNSWTVTETDQAAASVQFTVASGGSPAPTSGIAALAATTPLLTNGTFATNSFDGTNGVPGAANGWYRCYAERITSVANGLTPIDASPAPVALLTPIPGSTAPPTPPPSGDITQQSTTPSSALPPSGNANFALVGYAGGTFGTPASGKPNKANTGICENIAQVPHGATLTLNLYEGGDDNWSKADDEVDLYPTSAFTLSNGTATAGTTVSPTVRLIAENNCYDSAAFEPTFLAAPFGTGTVANGTGPGSRWSGCPETPGGGAPDTVSPSSGGGFWYSKSVSLSAYAGDAEVLFIGISRDAGASAPNTTTAGYYNYVFVDNVVLSGT